MVPPSKRAKSMDKPWRNHGGTMDKPWTNHGQTMDKPLFFPFKNQMMRGQFQRETNTINRWQIKCQEVKFQRRETTSKCQEIILFKET